MARRHGQAPRAAPIVEIHSDPYYTIYSIVCYTALQGCTKENVFEALRIYPSPGRDYGVPVSDYDLSPIVVYGVVPSGLVSHEVDEAELTVYNFTVPDEHLLDPGWVMRSVVTIGDAIYVRTIGVGVGPLPGIIESLASGQWGTLDLRIQMYVYQYDIKPNYPGDTIILPGNPLLGQPPPTLGF